MTNASSRAVAVEAMLAQGNRRRRGANAPPLVRALLNYTQKQPVGAGASVVILLIVVLALLAPVIAPYPMNFIPENPDVLKGPSAAHWMGTDQYGRDVMTRLLYGARVSMYVGIGATIISSIFAAGLGMAAAYLRGWVDAILVQIIDVIQAIPAIILLVAILSTIGSSLQNIVLVLAFRASFVSARVVRGAALGLSQEPYIEAARAVGCTSFRTMLRHLLPNVMPVLFVLMSVSVSQNIITEASLSFLGYGVKDPTTTWGAMVGRDSWTYMISSPSLLLAPTTALVVTVLAVNLFGDALRDHLDPRLRSR